MVIQCSSCDTRFKIADDKVKAGGVKVRCSKCKEVFTVLPPEEEQAEVAPEPAAVEASGSDWNDMNASFGDNTDAGSAPAPGLEDVDWGSLNGVPEEETTAASEESASGDDFSFGDDSAAGPSFEESADEAGGDFSFGEDEQPDAADDFSFGDDDDSAGLTAGDETDEFAIDQPESGAEPAGEGFAFGGSAPLSDDAFGFEESVGEGAQDEFSFDEEPAAAAGGVDDFDWEGSSAAADDDDEDDFGFGESGKAGDSLDFSSLEMAADEEPSVQVDVPAPPPPTPEPLTEREEARPANVRGPQKAGAKGRRGGRKVKAARKTGGPLRTLLTLLLLLVLLAGGGLYGLKELGFWSGNIEELADIDYAAAGEAAWQKAQVAFNNLIGNETALQPAGAITVTEMGGRYIQNANGGMLFIIDGKVRNDYQSTRSAIAVRGVLYNTAGAPVKQLKVYCGNVLSNDALRTGKLDEIMARGKNEFGDSLSNLDVKPNAILPFMIVFDQLPDNLAEYNVEPAESAPGTAKR